MHALEMHQARKGTWTVIGLTFVHKGIKDRAITGQVHGEEASWYRRYVPDSEMVKWVVRISTVKMMEEGKNYK